MLKNGINIKNFVNYFSWFLKDAIFFAIFLLERQSSKATMPNITIVGAGSAIFSMDLIINICVRESLWGSTIILMDISEKRLNTIYALAERYRDEAKAELHFRKTMDRREALEGAEFVICAVKEGGYDPMEKEREIAEEHGFYRGIGDRVSDYYGGIGAYHQLRFFMDLARDMEEICPDAYLIETANPVFEGTNLLTRESKIKIAGVCHGHVGYLELTKALGLPTEEVSAQMAGFNHCIWLTYFSYRGKDAYPLIDEWVKKKSEAFWKSAKYLNPAAPWHYEQLSPSAVEMYRLYGLFPIGDAVRSAAPWWLHSDFQTKQRWYGPLGGFDSEKGWSFYLKRNIKKVERYAGMAEQQSASLMKEFPLQKNLEQHIPIVDALANDKQTILRLNIPNKGSIDGIPDDVVVEIPALVSGSGIQPIRVGKLPAKLMHHVLIPRMNRMEQILHAFLRRDRESLVLGLMEDSRTQSYEQAKTVIDELLCQPWNTEADKHYR